MIEIWLQVWITESKVQWVRVVEHRHQLRCRRLVRATEVEESQIGIVIDLIAEHRLRRPVEHLYGRIHSVCHIPCVSRIHSGSQLCAELLLLVAEVHSCPLGNTAVVDIVGIILISKLTVSKNVVSILHRLALAPVILIVGLKEEILGQRLGIHQTASH